MTLARRFWIDALLFDNQILFKILLWPAPIWLWSYYLSAANVPGKHRRAKLDIFLFYGYCIHKRSQCPTYSAVQSLSVLTKGGSNFVSLLVASFSTTEEWLLWKGLAFSDVSLPSCTVLCLTVPRVVVNVERLQILLRAVLPTFTGTAAITGSSGQFAEQ